MKVYDCKVLIKMKKGLEKPLQDRSGFKSQLQTIQIDKISHHEHQIDTKILPQLPNFKRLVEVVDDIEPHRKTQNCQVHIFPKVVQTEVRHLMLPLHFCNVEVQLNHQVQVVGLNVLRGVFDGFLEELERDRELFGELVMENAPKEAELACVVD